MSRARDLANLGDGITTTDLPDITADKLDVGQIGGRRNLIINGAMQVAQRGTTFDFAASNGAFTLDRFFWQNIRDDQLETRVTQDTTAPTGFANSLKVVATTAESAWDIDEFARFIYKIEAQDLQQLDYGASTAKSVTMSFWVKSDVIGTYSVSFYVPDADRRLGSTYTINAADTWEYKTITFVGDTAGTGINNDNGEGIQISFCLAAGSNYTGTDNTSWAANSDANTFYGHTASWGTTINDYWQITGVQLEVGSVATPFEHRSYGEELALCQRYFWNAVDGDASANAPAFTTAAYTTDGYVYTAFLYPMEMRVSPSVSFSSSSHFNIRHSNNITATDAGIQGTPSKKSAGLYWFGGSGSANAGSAGWVRVQGGNNAYIYFDAEL